MALTEQVEKLITRLTELTEQQKISWQETAREDTFLAPVGNSVVTVGRIGFGGEVGQLTVQVTDNKGKTVEEITVPPSDPDRHAWEQLKKLVEVARKSAVQSDLTISDVLSSLEQIR